MQKAKKNLGLLLSREFQLLIIILLLCIVFGFSSDLFFSMDNVRLLLSTISVYGIVVSGMAILMISGGFDLSVGSVYGAAGMFLGLLLVLNVPVIIAIALTIILGILIGLFNGALIAKANISPFIITLGGFFLFRGIAFVIGQISTIKIVGKANISSISGFPESFNRIAGGTFFGFEYIVFYMIPIVAIFSILLNENVLLRQNYNIGGNELASRLTGIKVDRIKIFNYTLVSTLVAIAAVLRTSRMKAASAGSGEDMALELIAAIIIGGGSLNGGKGSVLGSFLGIALIKIIQNGLVLLGMSGYYEKLYVGSFLLFAVLIDRYLKKAHVSDSLKI